MNIFWIFTAILFLVVVAAWMVRIPVLQGRLLPEWRWLFASVAPPEDYYVRLAFMPISVGQPGVHVAISLQHKYVGKHVIGLVVSKAVPQGVPSYSSSFRLLFRCEVNSRVLFEKGIGSSIAPWWSKSEAGFLLIEYDVPKDLPLEQELSCVISVEEADSEFERLYGPIKIFARKATEK